MKLQYIVRLEIKKLSKVELFYYNAYLSTSKQSTWEINKLSPNS